ncbi:MAG TPA: HAD-IA family hydrolase [Candidatus Limnocylindrales bacterium]|nr:HAD-IA family hydrolase [Candidatus Limnocylindrales bacterium]
MLPALVCFDAGFTLMRPRETMEARLSRILQGHGHEASAEDLRLAWEAADAWFWETYHQPGNDAWTNDAGIDATWRSYHRLMLEHLGFGDREHELLETILASHLAADAWEPYEDTIEALDLVRSHPSRAGLAPARIAVISDFGSNLTEIMAAMGLDRFIDVLAISAVEGLAKPDPELFLETARRAGGTPGDAVMIGDSHRADVVGARAAGMAAILLDRNGTATNDDVPIAGDLLEAVAIAAGDASGRTALAIQATSGA